MSLGAHSLVNNNTLLTLVRLFCYHATNIFFFRLEASFCLPINFLCIIQGPTRRLFFFYQSSKCDKFFPWPQIYVFYLIFHLLFERQNQSYTLSAFPKCYNDQGWAKVQSWKCNQSLSSGGREYRCCLLECALIESWIWIQVFQCRMWVPAPAS